MDRDIVILVLQNFKEFVYNRFEWLNEHLIVIPFERISKYFCFVIDIDDINGYKGDDLILQLRWDKKYWWTILDKEPNQNNINNFKMNYADRVKTLLENLENLKQEDSFKQKS